jgi:hypothetical protein
MPMSLPPSMILGLILTSAIFATPPQKKEAVRATSKRATLNLCDLIREPDAYDGKEVTFRSTYLSTFEHSAFVDGKCTDKDHLTWVAFDDEKIESSTKPEIFDRVKAQIFCCMYAGLDYFRETKVVVTGVFVSSPNRIMANGKYGHDSMYRFLVTVKSVHEIKPTKRLRRLVSRPGRNSNLMSNKALQLTA